MNKILWLGRFLKALFSKGHDKAGSASPTRLLLIIFSGAALLLAWSSSSEFDQVVGADAKIVTYSKLQTVQHLEGGIVEKINVSAGQIVKKGDLLLALSDVDAEGGLLTKKNEIVTLAIRLRRLQAEVEGGKASFPIELRREAASLVASEEALLQSRYHQQEASIGSLQMQKQQRISDLEAARRTFQLVTEERDVIRKLVDRGLEPKLEAVRSEKTYAEAVAKIQSLESGIREMDERISMAKQEFRSGVLVDLSKTVSELTQVQKQLPVAFNKFERALLRSPVDGVVNRVLVSTVGGVLKAGEAAIEIVPVGSRLVLEAKVTPGDIGFLRKGQTALVKLNTYDFSIFGSLPGVIDVVGSDAVPNEKGETFYIVKVELLESKFKTVDKELPLLPGMTARIDIITGKRSVLSYVFSPITKTLSTAFSEK
ncbi:AcrA Membrane-fusion protein [Oxalobacteraceae bacterium]